MRSLTETAYKNIRDLAEEIHVDYNSPILTACRVASFGMDNPRKKLDRFHGIVLILRIACSSMEGLSSYIKDSLNITEWQEAYDQLERDVKASTIDKYIGGVFSPIVAVSARAKENHWRKFLYKARSLVSLLESSYSYIKE